MKLKINATAFLTLMFFMLMNVLSFAQNASRQMWASITEAEANKDGIRRTIPSQYKSLRLDAGAMKNFLLTAPHEPIETGNLNNGLVIDLPMPDGSFSRFMIFEYDVMHPELAKKFPEIKTYTGKGIDDNTATIKLDFTQFGFHAMVRSANGNFFIDPYHNNTITDYICYDKKYLLRQSSYVCEANDEAEAIIKNNSVLRTNGTQLRTYRLALACTGEYAAFFGGTVSGATAGMTTTMNRVNGVYESELSIRMVIIANNNLITYTNSSTDPYTNGSGSTMLGENQTTCDNIIGSANYDMGHVVSTGGGGVAGLGVICSSGNKARGVTGSGSPTGDSFDIDYVAHEMGHQFGGSHTFNSVTSSCNGNRSSSAAFEPGSGITIQAYAGICGSDNLASNSIAYFHGYSLDQMITYSTTGTGNTCPAINSNGNTAPVITNMGYNTSIPYSTPFQLTGSATDANGDVLTYSWEERDLGTAGAWNVQSTTAPQFRTFTPVTTGIRIFPKMSDIVNNTTTIGELLPNQARTLKFRLTARDNRVGGGGIMHPDTNVTITVVNTGAAFAVTSPNTAVSWAGSSVQNITWNVSGTTANGINTANVKISLSTDGGYTYPTVLIASTANDGTENVTLPNISTTTARVKVEAVGNIFFDISNTNFTITASAGLTTITTSSISPLNYCAGAALNVSFTTNAAANAGNVFTAQLSNGSGSFADSVIIGTLTSINAGTISCVIPSNTVSGSAYRIRVVSSSPAVIGSNNGNNIVISAQVAAAGGINTAFTDFCGGLPITFTCGPIANATYYNWTPPAGAAISSGQGTQTCVIAFPASGLSGNVMLNGQNANCVGTASSLAVTAWETPQANISGNLTFCSNSSTTLTASPSGFAYQWSNGASTQSINVNSAGSYTVTVTSPQTCNTSATVNVSSIASPTPSISGTLSFCSGSSTTLNAGNGYSSYLWSTGATTQTINVSTAGTFSCTVTNSNGCSGSASVTTIVNANPTPSISGTLSFCSGSSTTLNAGNGYSSYLWSTGATTQTINVSTAGTFSCTVTNSNGCSGSASVTTIVNSNPVVTANATNATCGSSNGAVTTSVTNGTAPYSYSWSNGATTPNISNLAAATYSVTVTDANGCSGNTSATVGSTGTPTATFSASATSVCAGQSVTLSNTTTGTITSYQWRRNGVNVSGATNSTYTFSPSGVATYTLAITSSCGNSTSAGTSITANSLPTTAQATASTSGSTVLCSGSSVTLSVPATSGYSYQWQLNSANISGATNSSLIVNGAGSYRCFVYNSFGCSRVSNVIATSVVSNITATISAGGPTTICSGSSVTLTASPSGSGYSYQWLNNGSSISGATNQTYNANATGNYACTVSIGSCTSTSSTIAVNAGASLVPPINYSFANICNGNPVLLATTNYGSGYTYQWMLNGGTISGATNFSYSAAVAGNYSVNVSNGACSGTSSVANLVNGSTPVATFTTTATTVCAGVGITMTASPTGSGFSYQWQRGGANLSGATNSVYTFAAGSSYAYTVVVSNNCGSSTATPVNITVNPIPTASITAGGPTTFCIGGNVVFTATSSISSSTFQWQKNSANIAGATSASYTATTAGAYRCIVTSPAGCARVTNSLSVTINCRLASEEVIDDYKLYPNPANNEVTIQWSSDDSKQSSVDLINLMGDVVKKYEVAGVTGANSLNINLNDVIPGIYFIKINDNNHSVRKRIQVIR